MAKLPPGVNQYIPEYDYHKVHAAAYEELRKEFAIMEFTPPKKKSDPIELWIEKWIRKNA